MCDKFCHLQKRMEIFFTFPWFSCVSRPLICGMKVNYGRLSTQFYQIETVFELIFSQQLFCFGYRDAGRERNTIYVFCYGDDSDGADSRDCSGI